MTSETLTGRTRHVQREHWRTKPVLVLQVECTRYVPEPHGSGDDVVYWRDAAVSDVTTQEAAP
jgi:hypothetical protein